MNIQEKARSYAITCHSETNHRYDGKPYEVHLEMVVAAAQQFIHLIPEAERDHVLAGCWTHDVIEDCRQTYNDVKQATSEQTAELAYALTNEKGKNRAERANAKYYEGIRNTPHAVFVKCCDRIANASHSKNTGSRMFELYRKEHSAFREKLYVSDYDELFRHMDQMFV